MNFGIYIHIPFCVKKCGYCDFFSVPVEKNDLPHMGYSTAVKKQLERDCAQFGLSGRAVRSIYFGGGTPSLMPPVFFEDILSHVSRYFKMEPKAETSCEINPATTDLNWFRAVRQAGVTRISIGAQSFQPRLLKALGRIHTAKDAMRAIAEAQDSGFESVGVDIMYALPHETMSDLEDDLRTAMTFGPQHISAYQLTIEGRRSPALSKVEGSLVARRSQTNFQVTSNERQILNQMRMVSRMLSRGGWRRYEVSNFAKPGFECRHNLNYWGYGEYLGLGAGAVSFLRKQGPAALRISQVKDVAAFLKGQPPDIEDISQKTAMGEFCFMGLRKSAGIPESDFEEKFGASFDSVYGRVTKEFIARGLIEYERPYYRLTQKGLELSNIVFAEFV